MADTASSDAGQRGEDIAARHLEQKGYHIRERNYRCRYGEIDLIATDGEYLVFVEVKTRSAQTGYAPTLAMTARKMRKVRQLGQYYWQEHPEGLQPRFDVVAVVLGPQEQVEHIVNAF